MSDVSSIVTRNFHTVQNRIVAACERAGRSANDVDLIAVTKYAEWEWVTALSDCHQAFGENRPQQLTERSQLLPLVKWHLIGQLQRNKAKLAVENAAMIHSIDSVRLLEKVSAVAGDLQLTASVLLQMNISGEASKSGFTTDELNTNWDQIQQMSNVAIRGFMTMAPATDDETVIRKVFRDLRLLRNKIEGIHNIRLPELSMGMSGDFEIAIEEGATLVRIGSLIFEGLKKPS